MMNNLSKLSIITLVTGGFLAISTPPSLADRTIRCESHNDRYNYCRVDTRGGVALRRQLSDSDCRLGRTWGYNRNGIWVDRGCRGQFTLFGRGHSNDNDHTAAIVGGVVVGAVVGAIVADSNSSDSDTITCSSRDDKYTRCSANIGRDRVYLKRQLSDSGCWEGHTWGYDRNAIWVDQGCRAEFKIRR